MGILVVVIAMQRADFAITRSAVIAVPPATIFPLVNDFHQWPRWSPWEKLDPAMQRTLEGSEAGTCAIYRWDGNSDASEGRMIITDSKPAELILMKMEYTRPLESICVTELSFKPRVREPRSPGP